MTVLKRSTAALVAGAALAATAAAAQDYPERTVEVIHHYGPGGGTDRFVRAVADPFAEIAGQQMVPVSIQGGGGIPAIANFTRRPADGYTLMAISPAQIISHVQGRTDMAEFMPLARVQFDQALIWVPADSPYETIQDMLDAAKAEPGSVSVALSGAGGFDEVAVSLFGLEADAQFTTVPFSSSEMVSNTVGGQVDAMFEEFGPARGLWESGDLRPLVLFSEERLPELPDVPTAQELGYDMTLGRWRAFAMQDDDDPAHAEALFGMIEQAVETEGYKEFEEQSALQYRSELLGPEEFQAFIDEEIETYTAVMKQLGYIE
jgi:putative tricarboxylic transport membrane protein